MKKTLQTSSIKFIYSNGSLTDYSFNDCYVTYTRTSNVPDFRIPTCDKNCKNLLSVVGIKSP